MTARLKQTDLKALDWFCQTNNLKPGMSVPPFQMNFTDTVTGLDKTCHLDFITLSYKEFKADDARRRRREKNENQDRQSR